MSAITTCENFLLSQTMKEVRALYFALFEFMQTSRTPLFNRFILTHAFENVFFPVFKTVTGHCVFSMEPGAGSFDRVQGTLQPHHWLIWNDDHDKVVDVLPVDGFFGISAPQCVYQTKFTKRYIPSSGVYPTKWNDAEKKEFNVIVSSLVDILQDLQAQIPQ